MPLILAADRRVRVEVWTDYPFATTPGVRVAFLPRRDLVHLTLPDGRDRAEQAQLELVPSAAVIAAATARRVLRVVRYAADGTQRDVWYFRLHVDQLTLGPGQAQFTLSAVQPVLDWGTRRMTTITSGGLTSFTFGGVYTPTQVLTLLVASLAARGRGEWSVGTVTRTDPQQIDWTGKTELEVLALVEQQWESETAVRLVADAGFTVDLVSRVGSTTTPPVLRLGGALVSIARTRDASDLATRVLPFGAADATLGLDAWDVASVTPGTGTTGVVGLTDGAGGYGPVQEDTQLVGAYLQKPNGTRTLVTATARNDGWTSLVTVADCTGLVAAASPADVVEFRAAAAGTRLVAVSAPAAVLAALGEVEAPYIRTDLTGGRNHAPNPALRAYTSPTAPPAGYTLVTDAGAGGRTQSIQRVTSGYPVGCPSGDLGFLWRWRAGVSLFHHFATPFTPAIDPVAGDAAVSFAVLVWIDYDLHSFTNGSGDTVNPPLLRAFLRDGSGTQRGLAVATPDDGRSWLTLGQAGVSLATLQRLTLDLVWSVGSIDLAGGGSTPFGVGAGGAGDIDTYVAFVQVTRSMAVQDWFEGAPVNRLRQVGNAWCAAQRAPTTHYDVTARDRSETDARYSDQAFVSGGDVILRATDFGINDRVRLLSRPVTPASPGAPVQLTLVAAPDPAIAAQLGAAAPGRALAGSDYLASVLAGTSG